MARGTRMTTISIRASRWRMDSAGFSILGRAHARMWHTGSTMGFRTVIERFTAEKLTIVVLSNRTDLDLDKLALQVYRALIP